MVLGSQWQCIKRQGGDSRPLLVKTSKAPNTLFLSKWLVSLCLAQKEEEAGEWRMEKVKHRAIGGEGKEEE